MNKNKFTSDVISNIRNLNHNASTDVKRLGNQTAVSSIPFYEVVITAVDTSQGFPLYTVSATGLNRGESSNVFSGVRGDDNSTLSVGDIAMMVKDHLGRKRLITSSGGSVSLENHYHVSYLLYS